MANRPAQGGAMRVLVFLVLVFSTCALGAQSSQDERVAVLKYGIESEVLDLVRNLRQEKNLEYRDVLIGTFATVRTDDLKEAILLLFSETKDNGLQETAAQVLASPDKKSNSLLLNCLSYLTELKYGGVTDTLVTLTQDKNKVLALGAIRALGKLGAQDKAGELIRIYKDAETDPNFKPDLIWALGEMKSSEAVELFLKEYDENESQPLLRRSLLEALGKIGDGQAWDRVELALSDSNTDLRAAAVSVIAAFPGRGDKVALLTASLRDSQVAVRQAAAQAAQAAKLSELKELLTYRAKKDPDAKVRTSSLQALAAYDDGASAVLVFLGDRKGTDPTVWREALNLALTRQYPDPRLVFSSNCYW